MSSIFYFVPERQTLERWRELPPSLYAFVGQPAFTEVTGIDGPNGTPGTIYHDGRSSTFPVPIEWHAAASGDYWFGWHANRRPGPADLQRGVPTDGYDVPINGEAWRVPIVIPCKARAATRPTSLPLAARMSEKGIEWLPRAEYDWLCEQAAKYLALIESKEISVSLPDSELMEYFVELLQVNYRLGLEEIAALGLADLGCVYAAVAASVDLEERFNAKAVTA